MHEMRRLLKVPVPGREYEIEIDRCLLDRLPERISRLLPRAERLFVVTDETVGGLYGNKVLEGLKNSGFTAVLHTVPAGERSKCVSELANLWETMTTFKITRTDAVVALGGGVVGDLAGFAASTVLRGIDFVQVPTTLLAQVDSSVGGKVGIDLSTGKNLAGAFWQPKAVCSDTACLDTLSDKIFADGMAEVIKYGCIRDENFFKMLEKCSNRVSASEHIEDIVYRCCEIKSEVVAGDERDTGQRMLLNFGHTIGHAFELAGDYSLWSHGQAVAAGMVCAAHIGAAMGITPEDVAGRISKLVRKFGLPDSIPCGRETMRKAVALDKKSTGKDDISLIVLERLGNGISVKIKKEHLYEILEHLENKNQ